MKLSIFTLTALTLQSVLGFKTTTITWHDEVYTITGPTTLKWATGGSSYSVEMSLSTQTSTHAEVISSYDVASGETVLYRSSHPVVHQTMSIPGSSTSSTTTSSTLVTPPSSSSSSSSTSVSSTPLLSSYAPSSSAESSNAQPSSTAIPSTSSALPSSSRIFPASSPQRSSSTSSTLSAVTTPTLAPHSSIPYSSKPGVASKVSTEQSSSLYQHPSLSILTSSSLEASSSAPRPSSSDKASSSVPHSSTPVISIPGSYVSHVISTQSSEGKRHSASVTFSSNVRSSSIPASKLSSLNLSFSSLKTSSTAEVSYPPHKVFQNTTLSSPTTIPYESTSFANTMSHNTSPVPSVEIPASIPALHSPPGSNPIIITYHVSTPTITTHETATVTTSCSTDSVPPVGFESTKRGKLSSASFSSDSTSSTTTKITTSPLNPPIMPSPSNGTLVGTSSPPQMVNAGSKNVGLFSMLTTAAILHFL